MANVIKYSTTKPSQSSLRKGNLAVGIGDGNYGPTSTTGFVNGMDIPNGGYVVYLLHNNSPAAYVAYNDTDLIAVARTLGNSGTTVTSAKEYLAGRSDTWILNNIPPNIVTDDLILNLDANDVSSYPTTGTTWYDVSGANNNGEMINGLSFNSGGWMDFDGADDYIWVPNDNGTMDAWNEQQTIIVWEYHDFTSGRRNIWNQAYGGFGTWTHEQGGYINYYFGDSGANARPYVSANSSTTVRGQWNMLCVTRDLTTINWYQNGVLTSTRSNPYGSLTNTTAGVTIGTGYTGNRWQGKMSKILAYTKALTPSEVLQNYHQAPIVTDGLVFAVDAGNLVSYENGDITTNSLVGSSTGTLVNGVGFSSANGGTWDFDGVDDYIELTSNSDGLVDNGSYTLSAWLRPNGSSWGSNAIPLYNTYSNGTGNFGIWHHFGHDNILRWRHRGSSYTTGDLSGIGLVADTWQLTTITWDGTTLRLYKNGVETNSTTAPSNFNRSTGSPRIGRIATRNSGTMYHWNGDITSHQVYNRALTAEEVTQNYNAQVSRFQ